MENEGSEIQYRYDEISLLPIVFTINIVQKILLAWNRKHLISFQVVTSYTLWLTSYNMAIYFISGRFIIKWIIFSMAILNKLNLFIQPQGSTIRSAYEYFNRIYIINCILSTVGSVIMVVQFVIIIVPIPKNNIDFWMTFGLMNLCHGLFFGVLGQDIAEIFISKIAANLGYPQGLPNRTLDLNICGICNTVLLNADERNFNMSNFQLTCGHRFHKICIQGWCIVRKKQTCPHCNDQVDLKRMCSNKWETYKLLYGQLVNWLRWFVAWSAIFIMNLIITYTLNND